MTFNGGRGGMVRCTSPTMIASGAFLESLVSTAPCQTSSLNRVTLLQRSGNRGFNSNAEAEKAVRSVLPEGWDLQIYRPEEVKTLAGQIAAVSRSRVFVGVHGAGMLHELFLPPKARVVEIFCGNRSEANHHYMNLESMADIQAGSGVQLYTASNPGACSVDASAVKEAIQASIAADMDRGGHRPEQGAPGGLSSPASRFLRVREKL